MSDLRLGVVGTGAIGQKHIARFMNELAGATVVAVGDANIETAKKVAEKYEIRLEENCDDVIGSLDVDAVVVTAWDPAHKEYVLKSIAAGKPVFCEKPLAPDSEGCREIVEAEMKYGKRLVQVGFMRRFDKGYIQLKKAVEDGEIGNPLILHCAHRNPKPYPDTYDDDMMITQVLIHEIDITKWLVDDEYEEVQLLTGKKAKSVPNDYLHDPQMAIFRTKKGVIAEVEINMDAYFGYDIQCEIVGDTGIIKLPDPYMIGFKKESVSGRKICYNWEDRFADTYSVELRQWIEDTKKGIVTGPNTWDGYVAAVTAEAFIKSRKEGKTIKINMDSRPDFYK